jgi:hypothetical protein
MKHSRQVTRTVVLALLPMAFGALGAWLDERSHLGFSSWRSACRAGGFTLESLVIFTLDLLPTALIGMVLGAVAMQFASAALWFRDGGPRMALAAHAGCAAGMAAGILICTQFTSVPLMLATELAATAAMALLLCAPSARKARCAASVGLPTSRPTSAY